MLLVDASGQYSWLMATSGHCVLDARLSSVTACWLMAIWMNVAHAVAAHWPHGHAISASVSSCQVITSALVPRRHQNSSFGTAALVVVVFGFFWLFLGFSALALVLPQNRVLVHY